MRNKKRGFTLIELLFVLAIITVVVTTTVVSYVSISGKQKEKDYQTMISNIRTASEVYLTKNPVVNIALKEQGYVSLSIEQLVREGLLNEYYTVNPKTKESMIGKCIIITLESEENKYNFSTPIPCGSYLSMETLNINNSQIQDNIDILYDKINVIDERGIRIISEEEDKLSEKKELIEIISINGKKEPTKEDLKIGQNEVVYKYDEKYFDRDVIVSDDKYCYIAINPNKSNDSTFEPYLIDEKRIIMTEEQVKSPKDLGLPKPNDSELLPIFNRSGYNFIGYSTTKLSPLDKNANIPDEVITFEKNTIECTGATAGMGKAIELYVVWQKGDSTYTILHKKQISTDKYESVGEESTAVTETGTKITISILKEYDKKYIGYTMNTSKTETVLNEISSPIISGGSNLTFDLYYDAHTYTLKIDRQNGTAITTLNGVQFAPAEGTKIANPTKTGYTFEGWTCTGCDPSTAKHAVTSYVGWEEPTTLTKATAFHSLTPVQGATVTLTAKWTPNKYIVNLSDTATIASEYCTSKTPGSKYECTFDQGFRTSIPEKAGYTFKGWTCTAGCNASTAWQHNNANWGSWNNFNTNPIHAGKYLLTNLTPTQNGEVTLKANWTPNTYTVTLDKSDGSGGTTTIYYKYLVGFYSDSAATKPITSVTIPQKTGYNFKGYYIPTAYTAQAITPDGIIGFRTSENITLKAKWEPKMWTCTQKDGNTTGSGLTIEAACTSLCSSIDFNSVCYNSAKIATDGQHCLCAPYQGGYNDYGEWGSCNAQPCANCYSSYLCVQ